MIVKSAKRRGIGKNWEDALHCVDGGSEIRRKGIIASERERENITTVAGSMKHLD